MEGGGDGKGKRRIQLFCPSVSKKVQISARDEQKLDLGSIARVFGLDPNTLKLNGHFISRGVDLISSSVTWKSLIGFFAARGLSTGATDSDAVVVGGKLCKIGPKSSVFSKMLKLIDASQKVDSVDRPPQVTSTARNTRTLATSPEPSKPRSSQDYIAEFEDPNKPRIIVPQKRRSSGSELPPKRTKGSSDASGSISIPTPNNTHFHTSILANEDPLTAMNFIEGLCPPGDRSVMEKLTDAELLDSFSLYYSKAHVRMSLILSRACRGFVSPELASEIEQLKEQVAELSSKLEKSGGVICGLKEEGVVLQTRAESYKGKIKGLEAENCTLKAELEQMQIDCIRRVDEARAEGERAGFEGFLKSSDGIALLKKVRDHTKRIFSRSEEFCNIFADGVRFYFDWGLDEAEKWLESKGFNDKFDRAGALENIPEPPNLEFTEEDSRLNTLGIEDYIAHLLLVNDPKPDSEASPNSEDESTNSDELGSILGIDDFDSVPYSSPE